MTDEERRRIHKDAKDVIENADSVREALLVWINQGHQDLASKAYAIKSRVKDENSLVRKVVYKIEQENRPRYTAYSATDIVGLRLLALNNDRLPTLVEAFVTFVSACQARNLNLFAGKQPYEAFKEIKLYQSKNNLSVYEENAADQQTEEHIERHFEKRTRLNRELWKANYAMIIWVRLLK